MLNDDNQHLIERARHDPEAFRLLYQGWVRRVYAYVAYRVPLQADAEDLTADIFMQVVKAIGRFEYRGEGSFAAWLFRIARNTVINHSRRYRIDALPLDDLPDIAGDDLLPEQALASKERFIRLYHAIGQLTPRRQEIVRLRYFGGLRNREIAQVLGLDERTVGAHLSRALDDLQTLMLDEQGSELYE
jgi:RNA polymerase sigma-70 factor (ECF subfamily)